MGSPVCTLHSHQIIFLNTENAVFVKFFVLYAIVPQTPGLEQLLAVSLTLPNLQQLGEGMEALALLWCALNHYPSLQTGPSVETRWMVGNMAQVWS